MSSGWRRREKTRGKLVNSYLGEILIYFLGKQGYDLLTVNFLGNKMKNMKVNGSYGMCYITDSVMCFLNPLTTYKD
jgi:hypothetical protein